MQRRRSRWQANIQSFLNSAVDLFTKHDLSTYAAALSFYAALSLAPLVVIILSLISWLGATNQKQFLLLVKNFTGAEIEGVADTIVQSVNNSPHLGTVAGILGIIALIFSASGVFSQLQTSLNTIFNVSNEKTSGIARWFRNRLLSIVMVAGLGIFAAVSLVLSTALSLIFSQTSLFWSLANFVASLVIFSFVFALLFKYLPNIELKWNQVLRGGFVTATLFIIGKVIIDFYLSHSSIGSAYGAAGSFILLLAWVYYSSMIVLAGAEITNVIAS